MLRQILKVMHEIGAIGDPIQLAQVLRAEWGGLWIIVAVSIANIILGVWRPRFSRVSLHTGESRLDIEEFRLKRAPCRHCAQCVGRIRPGSSGDVELIRGLTGCACIQSG